MALERIHLLKRMIVLERKILTRARDAASSPRCYGDGMWILCARHCTIRYALKRRRERPASLW